MKAALDTGVDEGDKTWDKLITRFQTEAFEDAALQSKFASPQAILLRTQRERGERIHALASLETVEAEMNRRRANGPGFG
jgi:hypothetical protein